MAITEPVGSRAAPEETAIAAPIDTGISNAARLGFPDSDLQGCRDFSYNSFGHSIEGGMSRMDAFLLSVMTKARGCMIRN